jgi:hypothetical protein
VAARLVMGSPPAERMHRFSYDNARQVPVSVDNVDRESLRISAK